jgi:cell division ATPase FtsA
MTIRARVELIESFTHNSKWRKFRRGSPQIITNPAEIQYYKNQPGFSVVLLDSEAKEKVVIKKVKSKSKSQQDEIEKQEEYREEEEEEEYDDEEEGEEETGYTEGMLKDFKKSQLRSLAADLELDIEGTKKELMARIINATNQS